MIRVNSGLDALARAEDRLRAASGRIATGALDAAAMAELLRARQQALTATQLIRTEDEIARHVLDILA